MDDTHRLGRRAQFIAGPLRLGIIATSPDPDDPAARLTIVDREAEYDAIVVVRPGDTVETGRRTLRFTRVVPGDRDGWIAFEVDGGDAPEERP